LSALDHLVLNNVDWPSARRQLAESNSFLLVAGLLQSLVADGQVLPHRGWYS